MAGFLNFISYSTIEIDLPSDKNQMKQKLIKILRKQNRIEDNSKNIINDLFESEVILLNSRYILLKHVKVVEIRQKI